MNLWTGRGGESKKALSVLIISGVTLFGESAVYEKMWTFFLYSIQSVAWNQEICRKIEGTGGGKWGRTTIFNAPNYYYKAFEKKDFWCVYIPFS